MPKWQFNLEFETCALRVLLLALEICVTFGLGLRCWLVVIFVCLLPVSRIGQCPGDLLTMAKIYKSMHDKSVAALYTPKCLPISV